MDGDWLKVIRKGHGLTQAQMAKELGVSRQAYMAWEQGRYKMPADKVQILLDGSTTLAAAQPKETEKQRVTREAQEKKEAAHWRMIYKALRCWPQYSNHAKAMAKFASQGYVIPQCAYAGIVADFPDILDDPNGDHPVTPESARAFMSETAKD